jgi:hypothetical protein
LFDIDNYSSKRDGKDLAREMKFESDESLGLPLAGVKA